MNNETALNKTMELMRALNLSIIFYYSLICVVTVYRICDTFGAYDFIASVGRIPQYPWRMPLLATTLYILLLFVSLWKMRWDDGDGGWQFICCASEILLCMGIVSSLNYYYSGIALMVLADLVHYVKENRLRVIFMLLLILLYAIGRYEIMPVAGTQVPFSGYLSYYMQPARGYLFAIESVMVSLNVLLFVYYMILLFTGQKEENTRILNLYDQIKQANSRLREYANELEHMTEIRERNRLAREIHDTLGHTLTGIIMGSEASLALFESKPQAAKERIEAVAKSARTGLEDVRNSIKKLRPDALEKHSLDKALEELISNFRLTTSVNILLEQTAGSLDFAADEEDALYRVVQECMTNAVRHGHATSILIRLTRQEDVLLIDIRDNGIGCSQVTEGFGLTHMQERLGFLGGSMTYGNRSEDLDDGEQGFFVITSLPIRLQGGDDDD